MHHNQNSINYLINNMSHASQSTKLSFDDAIDGLYTKTI